MKNIGGAEIPTTNDTFQIFIDGEIAIKAHYNFTDTSIQPEAYTSLYVNNTLISAGDRTLRVVGPQAIDDEFTFTI